MITTLLLPDPTPLIAHAVHDAPREACGLLIGRLDAAGVGVVTQIVPVANVAANAQTAYIMDEEVLARHLPALDRGELALLGFYHSHPASPPLPSSADVRCAAYPSSAYVIVSLRDADPIIAAWRIAGDTVERIPLLTGTDTLTAIAALDDAQPPSTAQRAAVWISTLGALVLLLIIALTLLPPAPPIPGR